MFWKPFQTLCSHILENANKESATIQCFGQRTFLQRFTSFKVFFQCFLSFKVSSKMCKTHVSWLLFQLEKSKHFSSSTHWTPNLSSPTLRPEFIFFPIVPHFSSSPHWALISLLPHWAPISLLPHWPPLFLLFLIVPHFFVPMTPRCSQGSTW